MKHLAGGQGKDPDKDLDKDQGQVISDRWQGDGTAGLSFCFSLWVAGLKIY
jgi:hypothetical protein